MAALRDIPLRRLTVHAHRLVRQRQITGEAALSLIVWPDPEDMLRYLRAQRLDQEKKLPEAA